MMGKYVYQIMFVNGRFIRFCADSVQAYDKEYTFFSDGEIAAEFKKDAIAGYMVLGVNADEDE